MINQESSAQLNPAWLDSPPEADFPPPPINTRAQTLPYGELSWENFERLILRIVRREANVSECWIYGDRGQKQYGLDILAELRNASGEFACYQCKRVDKFSSGDIQKAVAKFLEGKWASKTTKFVLCTSLQLTETQQVEEISRQTIILRERGIAFETWDASEGGQLCDRLKKYPDLVDDFFLREWVRLFNGEDAASSLGEKLDGAKLADLRFQLKEIYSTLFLRNDPGIRLGSSRAASLLYRYVSPAVVETREVARTEGTSGGNIVAFGGDYYSEGRNERIQSQTTWPGIQEIRMPIGEWLSRNKRTVILGEPGFGKSALLRVAVLQLLEGSDKPCSLPWHGLLPVWISFGGFSAAVQRKDDISIEDYFDQWLHKHGADPIRPLFERAVRYKEILLLIDGLDEAHNVHAARQAMDRVSTFLSIRPVPSVLTSRPRGYAQVRPDGMWSLARLAPFDEAQIECFARNWFKYLETEISTGEGYAWFDFATEQRKEDFLKAIRANPRVMDLARIPLFCQLLIDVFRFSHHLPEQRIKVYDKIIELLLSEHPAARFEAAGLPSPPNTPSVDDIREILIRLAFRVQSDGGAGAISFENCKTLFCEFLTDDVNGPGYSPYQARHHAKALIHYAQSGLGLLVERGPDELGFFHLTMQEYLAARAMARKTEKEQLDWLADVWDQSRWHEVVIAWFGIMGVERGKEATARAIHHLKCTAGSPFARLKLLLLRTELAVADFCLSPRESRATIEEAANQVETTPFAELRQELARHITIGLRSPSVAKQCEPRIANWVPARPEWEIATVLEVFGNWQRSDDLLHTFNLALHSESGRCRWVAAESLAKVYASDKGVEEHLKVLAEKWPDTGVSMAAMHALGKGWTKNEALDDLADDACRSTDTNLALTGIALRVSSQRHDAVDRLRIWSMFIHGSVSFEMNDFCREVLVEGWRHDERIKSAAMKALRDPSQRTFLRGDHIVSFLAESWPHDPEVGRGIAEYFESTSLTIPIHDDNHWRSLFKGFRGNKDITSALRSALAEKKAQYSAIYWGPDTKWEYCIVGDDAAKNDLLEAYPSVDRDIGKFWLVSALMEAWPEDQDVRDLLTLEIEKHLGR